MNAVRNMVVELINEPTHSFGSADNSRSYVTEIILGGEEYSPSSIHGVIVDGSPVIVVGTSGGATGIHDHSMLRLDDAVYFAVGPFVCRMTLEKSELDWSMEIDEATCFGVYHSERHDAFISHGELRISRFTSDGKALWTAGGADIFTEGSSLQDDCIEAIDFERRVYCFDHVTGQPTMHDNRGSLR